MKPSAPSIKGLIKIYKPEHPIRPVVNWRNAPAYKLAGLLTREIKCLAPPPYTHNTSKTTDLINELNTPQISSIMAWHHFDIARLYTNIPVTETCDIISNTLEQLQLESQTRWKLLGWYEVITQQNYFTSNGEILTQKEGFAMGAPTSGLLAEFFLQHLEQFHIPHLTKTQNHQIFQVHRWHTDYIRQQPLRYSEHIEGLQYNASETQVYSRM